MPLVRRRKEGPGRFLLKKERGIFNEKYSEPFSGGRTSAFKEAKARVPLTRKAAIRRLEAIRTLNKEATNFGGVSGKIARGRMKLVEENLAMLRKGIPMEKIKQIKEIQKARKEIGKAYRTVYGRQLLRKLRRS